MTITLATRRPSRLAPGTLSLRRENARWDEPKATRLSLKWERRSVMALEQDFRENIAARMRMYAWMERGGKI